MNSYNVSTQVALPVGGRDSENWFVQFRGVGTIRAHSAEHALRLALALGWRGAAVSQVAPGDVDLPPLEAAPRNSAKRRLIQKDAPPLPVRYLRIPRGEWR